MKFMSISDAMKKASGKVAVRGWVHRERGSNKMKFIVLRDVSNIIQCVVDRKKFKKQWVCIKDSRKLLVKAVDCIMQSKMKLLSVQ